MRGRVIGEVGKALLLAGVVVAPEAAVGAASLDRSLPFDALVWFGLLAMGLGLIFAYSGLPGAVLQPIALLVGAACVLYFVASILPDAPPDASLIERVGVIGSDAAAWYQDIASGGQSTNNVIFLILLALLSWVIGYGGAWSVFRERSAWLPITVSTTAMAIILVTFPNEYLYLLLDLVAALLLTGRMNFLSRQADWEATGLRRESGIAGRATRAGVAFPLALVALAWLAPSALALTPWSQQLGESNQSWRQAQEEFHRMFGGLHATTTDATASGFGREMTLQSSFHVSDTPVLTVAATRPEYWRVIVFDQYTGQGWVSSDPIEQHTQAAGDVIGSANDQRRADLTQDVTVLAPRGNYLVAAAQPETFDRAATTQAYPVAPGDETDLAAALSAAPLEPNSQYSVASSVSTASESELRADGADYPPEVRQRYLALPAIPDRVRQLAQQLTDGPANSYDKTVAVETYLRAIPYSVELAPVPPDRDAVDYFLFDVRTGYSDYFASSMVVLLRSAGIPARFVAGYTTGELQDDGRYLVKDSDSHSWVEVYFPSYGWIPFEPSGGWSSIARGDGNEASIAATPVVPTPTSGATDQKSQSPSTSQSELASTPTPTPTPEPEPRSEPRGPIDPQSLLPLLYLIGGAIFLTALLWWLWEGDLRGLPPAVVAYAKMTRLAGLLGFRHRANDTPQEFARALTTDVPVARPSAEGIAADYARYRFGRHELGKDEGAGERWRIVRNALLRHGRRLRRSGD